MGVIFTFEENGDITMTIGHDCEDALVGTSDFQYYIDVINGMKVAVENELDGLANRGFLVRALYEALSEADEAAVGVAFEPSDELLDAVADAKIVHLKDRMN